MAGMPGSRYRAADWLGRVERVWTWFGRNDSLGRSDGADTS